MEIHSEIDAWIDGCSRPLSLSPSPDGADGGGLTEAGGTRTGKLSTKKQGDDRPRGGAPRKEAKETGGKGEGEGWGGREGQWHKQVVLRTAKKRNSMNGPWRRKEVPHETLTLRASIGGAGEAGGCCHLPAREGVQGGVETLTGSSTRARFES